MKNSLQAKSVPLALVCCLALAGCQTLNKQQTGTGIGAAIGATVGALAGGDSKGGRIAGVLIGGLVGGFVGNQIGAYLDQQDKEELARSTESTLISGEESSWKNPETGVEGSVKVVAEEKNKSSQNIVVLKDRITEVPPMELVGEKFLVATSSKVNMRGGPGIDYKVVSSVSPNEIVDVVGRVEGKDWVMVADNGLGSGFIAEKLLKPTGQMTSSPVSTSSVEAANTETVAVQVEQTCRTVEQSVKLANGEVKKTTMEACQKADGSWAAV